MKTYKGEPFPLIITPEALAERRAIQAQHSDQSGVEDVQIGVDDEGKPIMGKPELFVIEVYFQLRGITDPVRQDMMRAFTPVRLATLEAFDNLFETF